MRALLVPALIVLVSAGLAGCISGDETPGDGDVGPIVDELRSWTLPETVTGLEHVGSVEHVLPDGTEVEGTRTTGIWIHDDKVYTSGSSLRIFDVRDPAAPVLLGAAEDSGSRDADIMEHPDGRLYAVLAGAPGVRLFDVTDPTAPTPVSDVQVGYHNIAVVPGTALVYNSRSIYADPAAVTMGGLVDIIDFTDPAKPVVSEFRFPKVAMTVGGVPKPVTATTCHDVTVFPEVSRAYCAGVTESHVWDITDPKAPKILQVVENPGTNIHHWATANKDHTVLIIGDELGGAAFAPGCTIPDQPYGGVWFVDISDLAMPTPLGYWGPEDNEPGNAGCTAHFGNTIEDRDLLVVSYYTGGAFLIDFSDPKAPKEIANHRPGTSLWDAQYYRGFIYTGDTSTGVDILKPTGDGEVVYTEGDSDDATEEQHQH